MAVYHSEFVSCSFFRGGGTYFLQDTKLYDSTISVHLRIFRTEIESVVGLSRHTLFVLYFYSKVGKFRYNFYLLILGLTILKIMSGINVHIYQITSRRLWKCNVDNKHTARFRFIFHSVIYCVR